MDYLIYAAKKTLATCMRTMFWLREGSITATGDSVLSIPSRDASRSIKAHVYNPITKKDGPTPVLLTYHGSGFLLPLHGSDGKYCRYVAENTSYTVIDVSYRLAPEYPFPAALNDVEDSVKWVLSQPAVYDLSHVAIGGFSAGANLACAAAACLFPPSTFRSLIAFYPPTDLSQELSKRFVFDPSGDSGKPIPHAIHRLFTWCYIPTSVDARDPRISCLFAQPEAYPERVLVITCAGDDLAPEGEALAKKIEAVKGKTVMSRRYMVDHGWNVRPADAESVQGKAKDEAYGLVVDMLRQ